MSDKTDKEDLIRAFSDVVWMAARYANGRSTYAPQMVRDAVKLVKEIEPSFKVRPDPFVIDTTPHRKESYQLESDWLGDIYE